MEKIRKNQTMCEASKNIFGSFRDPSGFIFFRDNTVYRQINLIYKDDYDCLLGSGLYRALVDAGLLIPHIEANVPPEDAAVAYKVIKPEAIPFVSYPYEWCFSQLKRAALTTLAVQKKALEFGMALKDASAYNIQFIGCRPLLIDTLSFEKYREGQAWIAYRQFCQHFLAPLALMSCVDIRLNQLTRSYIDGIPLDLASSMLPFRTYLRFSLLSHIHCHYWFQKFHENRPPKQYVPGLNRLGFFALIDNLKSAIEGLKWKPRKSNWSGYYADTN
ncbi:MAG: SAM-dependent methyltransferase, partial [Candidatus Omnitrophota bacterium]